MTQEQIDELKKHVKAQGLTQETLAEMFNVKQPHIGALLNGRTEFGKGTALEWEAKLGIRAAWLLIGDGEMLKPGTTIARGKNAAAISGGVSATSGGIAAGMFSGDVNVHHNGGKDMVIDEQKHEVKKMFEAIILAVDGFQQSSQRHDDYIKSQGERLDRIISNSYLRNERNMERIDKAMEQQNVIIGQQNKLIEMVSAQIQLAFEQSKRTQDRADALIEMLIAKK